MKLSVAICTWNRAALLGATLNQMLNIRAPASSWELIVVNNNSSDNSDAILQSFASRLPLRRLMESKPGLSNARNAAVEAATGDYVIWTDDDVLVSRDWLVAYERAFRKWPEAAVFGGPIRPCFEGTPPAWLAAVWQDVSNAFAVRDLGAEVVRLDGRRAIPYGANFAVRLAEQRECLYDPDLGRKLERGYLGEEVAVIRSVLDAGNVGWWVPDASVEHFIPRDRQTLEYIRNYYELSGRTKQKLDPVHGPKLFGQPRWVVRKALSAEFMYRVNRLRGDPRAWIKPFCDAAYYWGMLSRVGS